MDLSSACNTQHIIRLSSEGDGTGFDEMTDYMAREGRFRERGGLDRSVTASDAHLEGFLSGRDEMVAYYSRIGRYEGRGTDNPLTPGEKSGHCFCQMGLYDHTQLANELKQSGSNVVTSVVSVRRVDARELHMDCKEAFESLLRLEWSKMVESWGLIEPKDVRWVAFYHVDGKASLHCHVVTWDASGRWGGDDRRLIPREIVERGRRHLNDTVIRGQMDALNTERCYLRDAIATRIRYHLGREVTPERLAELERNRVSVGAEHSPVPTRPLSADRALDEIQSVRDSAPGQQVTQYMRSPEEVRSAARAVVGRLRAEDGGLDAMFARHAEVVAAQGAAKYHTDRVLIDKSGRFYNDIGAYREHARYELEKRAASEVCTAARRLGWPWERSAEGDAGIREARRALARAARSLDPERVEMARQAYAEAMRELGRPASGIRQDVCEEAMRRESERVATRAAELDVLKRRTSVEASRMSCATTEGARRALMATVGRNPALVAVRGCRVVGMFDQKRLRECRGEWSKGRAASSRGDRDGAQEHARNTARMLLADPAARSRIEEEAEVRHRAHPDRDIADDVRTASSAAEDRLTEALEREYGRQCLEADHSPLTSALGSVLSALARGSFAGSVSKGHAAGSARGRDRERPRGISRDLDASREAFRGR